jgi:two-component system sensor histidine kinase/response regulator
MTLDTTEGAELEQLRLAKRAVEQQLKQVQEELRRVKERLELAVSGSKACTWDFEFIDGDVANARVALNNYWELLGYEGAPPDVERLNSIIEYAVAPDDRTGMLTDLSAFLDRGGHAWEREGRMLHRDGTERWQLSRGVAARNGAGAVTRFTGASIDITDRKLTEKALLDSEERFRRTFENAAVGMILIDLQGRFLEYNARFCEFLGYSREELAGRRFVEFMMPDEVERDLEQRRSVVQGEIASFTRDKRYLRKDGAIVWGNITVSVIQRHADGTPVHVMGILQDITERKALEVEIEMAQARMQLAMRGSGVAVFDGDIPAGDTAASTWTYFNMWEPLGIDPATAPSDFDGIAALNIHPDDLGLALAYLGDAIQARSTDLYLEHRVAHSDGSVLWRLARGTLVYDDAGVLTRLVGTATDITKLKQIEGELSRAREAAESANRAKDEFLANVSHEIRTPMNAILGMTELALDSAPSEHQRQLLSTVRSAAKNLLTIINDLLDFSKIASGKLTLDRADFSLRAAVGDTLRALAVRAHRKGLELLCRVHPDVPDALVGDAGRLRQVLMNLVGNAIKFTPQGEVEVDVEAEPSSEASTSLIFTVRDTGIGIARDKQAAIFRAFEQEDSSTTRKYGGTGLGLTISAQLASLMGGDITVRSAPGCGSTFRFTARFARSARPDSATVSPERLANLRVLVVDDQQSELLEAIWAVMNLAPTVPASAGPAGGQPERSRPLRVLVAEDNELNVMLLRELLSSRGHLAQFAHDGRAALELALQGEFDLMLLDLHMPELDGFEVVQAIRTHERGVHHLRIIALTARSSARDRERCLAAGMDEFLAKPIEAAALWAAMERLVARWPLAAPAPRTVEPGLLDARAILRASGGQAGVLEKLRVVFRQTLPVQMARVRSALARGELPDLREAAHQLVGTVGAFSTVAASVASALEDAAIRDDRESCAALGERLGSLCDALLEATETLSIDSLSL